MGGGVQLGEPVGGAGLETQNRCAWQQGRHHLSSNEEWIPCGQFHVDQIAQWQSDGRCRSPWYRGAMRPGISGRLWITQSSPRRARWLASSALVTLLTVTSFGASNAAAATN